MPINRWTDLANVDFPLEVLADNYLAHLEGNGRSPHTLAGFRRVPQSFRAFLADKGELGTKEDLCPEAVAAYRAHLIGRKYALSSVRTHVQALKSWSAYLTEEQIYRTDPLARRGLLPKIPKPLPKFLTEEERERVLAHFGGPTRRTRATWRSSACSSTPGCGSRSWRRSRSPTSTGAATRSRSGGRAPRSGGWASGRRRRATCGPTSTFTGGASRRAGCPTIGSSSVTAATAVTGRSRSASR